MMHDICENSVIHVVSTCISSLVRQYTRTMNRSSFRMISSDILTTNLAAVVCVCVCVCVCVDVCQCAKF